MDAPSWTDQDTLAAEVAWKEYQRQHDVSAQIGQTAGIDPTNGEVFIGKSALEIVHELDRAGVRRPLYFVRVGYDYYQRKGGHR